MSRCLEAAELVGKERRHFMTMNIGQLMRGLLGDVQAGDSKALELKVGQIVRGVIMQTMDNNEAIVQINGTQVQAKLETALQSGQSTLLQVQPQSANGTLVLKMVDQQAAAFTDESVKEWVKALALPDQKWATDLVRDLRRRRQCVDPGSCEAVPTGGCSHAKRRRYAAVDAGCRAGL